MSFSPNSKLIQHTIDVNYVNKKRSTSLKWSLVNGALLMLFSYDLWCWCPGQSDYLRLVERVIAAILAVALISDLVLHAARRTRDILPLAPSQAKLLGLDTSNLDSSFRLVKERQSSEPGRAEDSPGWGEESPLAKGARFETTPRTPPSPPSPFSPPSPESPRARDLFLADRQKLREYLDDYEHRAQRDETSAVAMAGARQYLPSQYRLSVFETERRSSGGVGEGRGETTAAGAALLAPDLAARVLALRRWLAATVLRPTATAWAEADAALARESEPPLHRAPLDRLRRLARTNTQAGEAVRAILPFVEPLPDRARAAERVREMARGGALAQFNWTEDAPVLVRLFGAYLDRVLPAPPDRAGFSTKHLRLLPTVPTPVPINPSPPSPASLAVRETDRSPPHYVLEFRGRTLSAPRGRDNLLLTMLALLERMQLPASLNLHWVLEPTRR